MSNNPKEIEKYPISPEELEMDENKMDVKDWKEWRIQQMIKEAAQTPEAQEALAALISMEEEYDDEFEMGYDSDFEEYLLRQAELDRMEAAYEREQEEIEYEFDLLEDQMEADYEKAMKELEDDFYDYNNSSRSTYRGTHSFKQNQSDVQFHIIGVRFEGQSWGCYHYRCHKNEYVLNDRLKVPTKFGEKDAKVVFVRTYYDEAELPLPLSQLSWAPDKS